MKLDTFPKLSLIDAAAQSLLIESRRPGWTETFQGKIWWWFNNEVHREITLEEILDEIALHEWLKLPERWRQPAKKNQKVSSSVSSAVRVRELKSLPMDHVGSVLGQATWDAGSVLDQASAWPGCETIRIPKARVQFQQSGLGINRYLLVKFHFFTNANLEDR